MLDIRDFPATVFGALSASVLRNGAIFHRSGNKGGGRALFAGGFGSLFVSGPVGCRPENLFAGRRDLFAGRGHCVGHCPSGVLSAGRSDPVNNRLSCRFPLRSRKDKAPPPRPSHWPSGCGPGAVWGRLRGAAFPRRWKFVARSGR